MANKKTKLEKRQEMVERMGVYFEQTGLTPMHGRVFAYLLLAEPPHKDFYDIQEFLKASKSAISTALKYLMEKKMVKYMTFSGDRRRYFQVDMEGWLNANKRAIQGVATMKTLVQEVLVARSDSKYLEFNEKLEKMVRFNEELRVALDTFITKWDKENS